MVVNVRLAGRLIGLLTLIGLAACDEMPQTRSVTISGVTYTFPGDHVDAISPPQEDSRYARIHAPGSEFYLEHSTSGKWPNEQGSDVPTIPHINSAPGPHNADIEVIRTSAAVVVCDRAPRPEYDCGMRIIDAGVPWSVHFNRRHLSRIDALKSTVEKVLASYRGNP
jgi:hypothetical protein